MGEQKVNIRTAGKEDKQLWDQYVLDHPQGIAYQLFSWKEAVEKAYRFKACYFIAEINNKVSGVLPLISIGNPFLIPQSFVSLPYCDAGGPLADNALIEHALIEHALIEHALKLSTFHRSKKMVIRSTDEFAGFDPGITVNENKVRMILNLPGGSKELLSTFKAKVRSQVKKAYKNGLTSTMGSTNLLDDFYSVFSENMQDLGSPVHSKKWIYSVLKCYGNRAHAAVIYMPNGEPAAAGIVLCHPGLVSIPWASSLRRFNKTNANMLLYWTFLKFASDSNYSAFDFGRSTPGEGTYRFKKQWGALPKKLHWADFRFLDDKEKGYIRPVSMTPDQGIGKIRPIAEKIIRMLPLPLSTAFGSRIRKYVTL